MTTQMTLDAETALRNTLHRVNQARDILGLPKRETLPGGVIGQANDCVIARAIRDGFPVSVNGNTIGFQAKSKDGENLRRKVEAIAEAWGVEIMEFTTPEKDDHFYTLTCPADMREFILRFDHGQYGGGGQNELVEELRLPDKPKVLPGSKY